MSIRPMRIHCTCGVPYYGGKETSLYIYQKLPEYSLAQSRCPECHKLEFYLDIPMSQVEKIRSYNQSQQNPISIFMLEWPSPEVVKFCLQRRGIQIAESVPWISPRQQAQVDFFHYLLERDDREINPPSIDPNQLTLPLGWR